MRIDSRKRPHNLLEESSELIRSLKRLKQIPATPVHDTVERMLFISRMMLTLAHVSLLSVGSHNIELDAEGNIDELQTLCGKLVGYLSQKEKIEEEISRCKKNKSYYDVLIQWWKQSAEVELNYNTALFSHKFKDETTLRKVIDELRHLRDQITLYSSIDIKYPLFSQRTLIKNPHTLKSLSVVEEQISLRHVPQQFFSLLHYFLEDLTQREIEHFANPNIDTPYKRCLYKTVTLINKQLKSLNNVNINPEELKLLKSIRSKLLNEKVRLERKCFLAREISGKYAALPIGNDHSTASLSRKRLHRNQHHWITDIHRYSINLGNSIDKNLYEKHDLLGENHLIGCHDHRATGLYRHYRVRGPMHVNEIVDKINELMNLVTARYRQPNSDIHYIDVDEFRARLDVVKQLILEEIDRTDAEHIDAPQVIDGMHYLPVSALRCAVQCLGLTRKHIIKSGDIFGIFKETDRYLIMVIHKLTAKGASFTHVVGKRANETALHDVLDLPFMKDELILHVISNNHIALVLPHFREMMINESRLPNHAYGKFPAEHYRKLFQRIINVTHSMIEKGNIIIHASEKEIDNGLSAVGNSLEGCINATSAQDARIKITQVTQQKKECMSLPSVMLAIQPVCLHLSWAKELQPVIAQEIEEHLFFVRSRFMRRLSSDQAAYESTANERTVFLERLVYKGLYSRLSERKSVIQLMLPTFVNKIETADLLMKILYFISESNAYRTSFSLFNNSLLSLRILNKTWNTLLTHQQLSKYLAQLKNNCRTQNKGGSVNKTSSLGLTL